MLISSMARVGASFVTRASPPSAFGITMPPLLLVSVVDALPLLPPGVLCQRVGLHALVHGTA